MPKDLLALRPIGKIRCTKQLKFDAPHQPDEATSEESLIELNSGNNFEQALKDLEGFDRIWLIWWFHKNSTWRTKVLPPRGQKVKRGVFATRSPHRPNPIGITAVKLIGIKGRTLRVGPIDLLDGTPILDIKPYIPTIDSFVDAKSGWVGELEQQKEKQPKYEVMLSPLAQMQLRWLKTEWGIDFFSRAKEILAVDPMPHRTRRISKVDGKFRMGCGAWRLIFRLNDSKIEIESVAGGYPTRSLNSSKHTAIPDREAQIAFINKWTNVRPIQ